MVVPSSNSLETKLFKLMAGKEKLESRINTYGEVLAQNGNIGMNGPLIDAEGFPRNDIDIYQVRQARQQIICLQNDHKTLMNEIEQLLHELHANTKNAQNSQCLSYGVEGMNINDAEGGANVMKKPILKVKHVAAASPAEQAGLRQNDEIIEFGSANADNFDKKLDTVFNIVNHMRDRPIPIKSFRNNEILDLILIPQTWSGPGLLGCSVTIIDN